MELNGQRLLNIFFVGQSELKTLLSSQNSAALRQRITLYYELNPFSEQQTAHYVRHRLKIAGTDQLLFTPGALHAIQRFSGGYPRAINILCDRALLTGYVKECDILDDTVIAECMSEISINPKGIRRMSSAATAASLTTLAHKAAVSAAAWITAGASLALDTGRDILRTATRLTAAIPRRKAFPLVLASLPVIAAVILIVATRSGTSPQPVLVAEPKAVTEKKAVAAVATADPQQAAPATSALDPTPPNGQGPSQESARAPDNTVLAEKALGEKRFQAALDLLDGARQNNAATARTATLYAQALVGLAEQVMSTSPKKAQTMLDQAVAVDPANAFAFFGLGKVYSHQKAYPQAIDAYQNVLRLDPSLPEAYFNLGFIYATTGKYASAEEMFTQVVQMKPDYLDKALFNLAIVQQKRGKNRQSVANLEHALAIRPDNPKVQAYLDQFRQAHKN
jgi:Tfp pilus assembly protein PilF